MNTLYDKTTVKQLAKAVRQTSPDDWKASRKRRKHSWLSRQGLSAKVWILVTYLVAASFICIPFTMDEPQKLPIPTACGMMTLNFLILGVLCAGLFFHYTCPHLQPLVNTPADGRQVFLYVLNDIRKQMKRKLAWLLGCGLFAFMFMSLVVTQTMTWENILRATGGGLLIMGPALTLGCLLQMLPRFMNPLRVLLMSIAAFILCWQVTRLMTTQVPSFSILGEAMIILPQTKICQWILGGPLPLGAMLASASMMPLTIFLITNPLRDHGESFTDEDGEEPLELRAESFAAMALKKWRQEMHRHDLRDESLDDEDEAEDVAADENQTWEEELQLRLLGHDSAPKEHNRPVSEEFRQAMASRCRELLDAKAADCPLENYLSPTTHGPSRLPLAKKVAVFGCPLIPLLLEAWARLPEQYGKWFLIAAFSLLVYPVGITIGNPPHNFHMTSRQWVYLPLDPARHARRFFAYQRRLFGIRCLLVLRTIGAVLMGGIAWICLRSALGLAEVHPVTLSKITGGTISLITISYLLMLMVLRYWEAMSFFGSFFRFMQWQGHWRKLSAFYAFMTVISGGGLFGALFLIFAQGQNGFQWQNILLCLLLSEAAYQFNLWLAIQAARWGRGNWVGDK